VFVRQGKFALDPKIVAAYPPADLTVERISDLLDYNLAELISGRRRSEGPSFATG
jgi:hypothetical protein